MGELGLIPGLGRSPGEGKGYPLPVFWPGEFYGLYSPWVRKESDTTERHSLFIHLQSDVSTQMRTRLWVDGMRGHGQLCWPCWRGQVFCVHGTRGCGAARGRGVPDHQSPSVSRKSYRQRRTSGLNPGLPSGSAEQLQGPWPPVPPNSH